MLLWGHTVLPPASSASLEICIVFSSSYGKGTCQNANVIVNEPSPFESIAVVCFDAVPVQSIGPFFPVSFVLTREFALLSCYQDSADII